MYAGTTDVYGNAQFDLPDRRPLGIYSTGAEWDAIGGFSALNRRTDQRGGPMAFALPGELLGLSTMQSLADSVSPSMLADVSTTQRRALLEYGGFGDRISTSEDAISDAFARRHRLITATSHYAPVYRAMMQNSSLSGVRPVARLSPSGAIQPTTPNLPDTGEYAPSLYDLLRKDTVSNRARVAASAWERFAEGEYRQAARAFQEALVLDRSDLEAAVGEVFSYVAVDSMARASVLVQRLNDRVPNPFTAAASLRARLADQPWTQQVLIESRLRVDSVDRSDPSRPAAGADPHRTAPYAFILWYLGDRETARRAADLLARSPVSSEYADWPAKMRQAESEAQVQPGR